MIPAANIGGKGIARRFSWANYSLFPMVAVVSGVLLMATSFSIYSLFRKTDVALSNRAHPRWESVNPSETQKFLKLNQKYEPIPALEVLKKEMKE